MAINFPSSPSNGATYSYGGKTWTYDGTATKWVPTNILSDVTATAVELNYTDGVTSAIQTQLDTKITADVTGEFIADSYNETYVSITSTGGASVIDCEAGNTFSHVLTESTTIGFNNPPATGTAYTMSIEIIQDASASGYTLTWPASVDFPAATAPTLTADASAVDVFVFSTRDGGTTWYGFTAGQAIATPA